MATLPYPAGCGQNLYSEAQNGLYLAFQQMLKRKGNQASTGCEFTVVAGFYSKIAETVLQDNSLKVKPRPFGWTRVAVPIDKGLKILQELLDSEVPTGEAKGATVLVQSVTEVAFNPTRGKVRVKGTLSLHV